MELRILRNGVEHVVFYDEQDHELISQYKWNVQNNGGRNLYARGSMIADMKTRIYMHRLIMAPLTRSDLVDHINGNGLDNRRSNLRKATKRQNAFNSRNYKRHVKGVNFYKGRWNAQLTYDGIRVHLGRYDTMEEAASAYEKIAAKLHGEFFRSSLENETPACL